MNVSGSLVSDIHVNVQNTSTAFDMSHEFKRHLHKYHRAIPKRAVLCKGVQNLRSIFDFHNNRTCKDQKEHREGPLPSEFCGFMFKWKYSQQHSMR